LTIDKLYEDSLKLLEQGRFAEARELGHRLLKQRFSGAFEVLARAFHGEGQLAVALQVLESGVKEASVWPLWLLFGNYRSESGDLEGALEAYEQARACPGAERDQILFNEALMRLRFGNREKALELFWQVYADSKDQKLRVVALTHRLTTLVELDRVTEALMELGEAYLHESDNAELLSKLAFQLLEKGDRNNALNLALQALGVRRAGEVPRVVRLIQGERSERARLFEVKFRGSFPEEDLNFSKCSKVYADDAQEAEALAREFEPPDVRGDLTLESVAEIEGEVSEWKGVDWSSGLIFDNK